MAKLTYETPDEFSKDEEKWLKIFNKRSLIATLAAFGIGLIICRILSLFHLKVVGIIITILLMLIFYVGNHFEIPSSLNVNGVGCTLFELYMRRRNRKKKSNKVIYVKGYRRYDMNRIIREEEMYERKNKNNSMER